MTIKLVSLSSTSLEEAYGVTVTTAFEATITYCERLRFHQMLSGSRLQARQPLHLYYRAKQVSNFFARRVFAESWAGFVSYQSAANSNAIIVGYTYSERFISGSYGGDLMTLECQNRL